MAEAQEPISKLCDAESFKTVDDLRSLREQKGNRPSELLKSSAANKLYYKATPIDDISLEKILAYVDQFTEEREAKTRSWVLGGSKKSFIDKRKDEPAKEGERTPSRSGGCSKNIQRVESKLRRGSVRNESKQNYVVDVAMEKLMRSQADEAREKLRLLKYKASMKRFSKVYKILKGGGLDHSDALKMVNTASLREALLCKFGDRDEPNLWDLSRQSFPIKMETFAVNRRRLLRELSRLYTKAAIVLKGGVDLHQYDSTEKYQFHQEPFFLWTFGATEPNLWGCIDCWTGKATLLCDRLPDDNDNYIRRKYGYPVLEELRAKYEVDHVDYLDQLGGIISKMEPAKVLILSGENGDSKRQFDSPNITSEEFGIEVDESCLYDIMSDLRAIKTPFELDLMRYASQMSSLAHKLLMKRIGIDSYEYQAEALFKFFVHFVGGCRELSCMPLCSSGRNSSEVDYEGNQRLIKCGDMIIFDMGASYYGYCSSIACTIPAGGLFDLDQRAIYNVVLKVRDAALDVIRAGVFWSEVHEHAVKALLGGLLEVGIVKGEISDMLAAGVSTVFMPFGIGHFIGLDKFDVSGSVNDEEVADVSLTVPHFAQLRMFRKLKPGMVLTVQAGCYFYQPDLLKASAHHRLKKYLDKDVLERYLCLGGIFIKDNVVVTHQGNELLSNLPRTVEEIEKWMVVKEADIVDDGSNRKYSAANELWWGSMRKPCTEEEIEDE